MRAPVSPAGEPPRGGPPGLAGDPGHRWRLPRALRADAASQAGGKPSSREAAVEAQHQPDRSRNFVRQEGASNRVQAHPQEEGSTQEEGQPQQTTSVAMSSHIDPRAGHRRANRPPQGKGGSPQSPSGGEDNAAATATHSNDDRPRDRLRHGSRSPTRRISRSVGGRPAEARHSQAPIARTHPVT